MRVLVTGIEGFAGSHLAELLLEQGQEVVGTRLDGELQLLPEEAAKRCRLVHLDLRDRAGCIKTIEEVRPEVVYHLAAVSFVPQAGKDPTTAFDTNVVGSANLLEGLRLKAPRAKLIAISSCEVYGHVRPEELPLTENSAVRPASFYAATKQAVEVMAAAYGRIFGQALVILRPFNHIGPRQSPSFVASGFARQIAQIETGQMEPVMKVGNLEAKRDFTDVRDMVRAYALAAEKCETGRTYNISSGRVHAIRELLDALLSMARCKVEVRQDAALLRPSDTPVFEGDSTRFRNCTGWAPTVPFERTVADVLAYWRSVIKKQQG